eukprot:169958_1
MTALSLDLQLPPLDLDDALVLQRGKSIADDWNEAQRPDMESQTTKQIFTTCDHNADGFLNEDEFYKFVKVALKKDKSQCPTNMYQEICKACNQDSEKGIDWTSAYSLWKKSNAWKNYQPTAYGRFKKCEYILDYWLKLYDQNTVLFSNDLLIIVQNYCLYNVSIRITRPVPPSNCDWRDEHHLSLIQLQVYCKCFNKFVDKNVEQLCLLKFYDGSQSMKDGKSSVWDFQPPNKCIDGNFSHDSFCHDDTSAPRDKDHWMEFDIFGVYLGDIDDITKVILYGPKQTYNDRRLTTSYIQFFYDHNHSKPIGKKYVIERGRPQNTFQINPLKAPVPKRIELFMYGWMKANIHVYIDEYVFQRLYGVLVSFYMDKLHKDSTYIFEAHCTYDNEYIMYPRYSDSGILQTGFLFLKSLITLHPVNRYEDKGYYIQTRSRGKLHEYMRVKKDEENKQVKVVTTKVEDEASVFSFFMVDNHGKFPRYKLQYFDVELKKLYFIGTDHRRDGWTLHEVDGSCENYQYDDGEKNKLFEITNQLFWDAEKKHKNPNCR